MSARISKGETPNPTLNHLEAITEYSFEGDSLESRALWSSLSMTMTSILNNGEDLPVGGVAIAKDGTLEADFATDMKSGDPMRQAGFMAIHNVIERPKDRQNGDQKNKKVSKARPEVHGLITTIEPSHQMIDYLATIPTLRAVGFLYPRQAVAARDLVRPHKEDIFQRIERSGLDFEAFSINHPQYEFIYSRILDFVIRNIVTGKVTIDHDRFNKKLGDIMITPVINHAEPPRTLQVA